MLLRHARNHLDTRVRSPDYSEVYFLLEGTVSFLTFSLFPFPPSWKTRARLGPTTREMTSVRENEAFLHCVYDANDEF